MHLEHKVFVVVPPDELARLDLRLDRRRLALLKHVAAATAGTVVTGAMGQGCER